MLFATRIIRVILAVERAHEMTFRDADKMVRNDGWFIESVEVSHYHYIHATKPVKVTIPYHAGDIPKRVVNSIKKQAGLK
jgi:predicted RNA binding protein YcfA (HicA-like mRNA interferase family)